VAVSLTERILRSKLIMLLETYQGALVIRRQQIFWKAWMVHLFDFLAEPHTTTPYAQNGCMRILYNNILMFNVRFERRSGLCRCSLEFNFLRLFLRWADHVSHLSNIKPRFFTSFEWGIKILFIVTGGQ